MSTNVQLNQNHTVKDYIYILCKIKGITFKQLGNDLNIKPSYIYSYLQKSIDLNQLIRIIDYLEGDFNIVIGLLPNQTLILNKKKLERILVQSMIMFTSIMIIIS